MKREEILELIRKERKRQDSIHKDFPHYHSERLSILLEEVGEVAKCLNEDDKENLKEELVQVASVCVRWIEKLR